MRTCFLLLMAAGIGASEGYDEIRGISRPSRPEYEVDELPVHAMGNQDPESASFIWHPFALVAGGVDEEHQFTRQDGWDAFVRLLSGIELRWKPDPDVDGALIAQVERTRHRTREDRDGWEGRLDSRIGYANPWYSVRGAGGYVRERDPEEPGNQPVLRDDGGAYASWRRLGPGLAPGLDLAFRRIDYREDTFLFSDREADRNRFIADLRMGWRTQAGTGFGGLVRGTLVSYDHPGLFWDSRGITLAATWSPIASSYWNGTVECGYQVRWFDDEYNADSTYEDAYAGAPYLAIDMRYQPEIMTDLLVKAHSDLDDGRTSNAEWRLGMESTLRWRLRRDRWVSGVIGAQRIEDSGEPSGQSHFVSYVLSGEIGYACQITGGMTWRIRAGGSHVDPNRGRSTWVAESSSEIVAYW